MTQEDKDLLLKDLCTRLPYGVKVNTPQGDFTVIGLTKERVFTTCEVEDCHNDFPIESVKPYLFPLSSITEEQYYELQNYSAEDVLDHMKTLKSLRECTDFTHWPLYEYRVIDWFNKNHFDYRGIIPIGSANDATGLNIY